MIVRTLAALTFAAGVALTTTAVHAQQGDESTSEQRRDLLQRAFQLSNRGDHATALRLAEEASAIQITPSLLLFLAEEHEYLAQEPVGRAHLLDAVTHAASCVRAATAQTTLHRRERILSNCTAVLNRVNAQLARVRVDAPRPAPVGMVVHLNGRPLPGSEWGTAVPVLPGEVVVDATAPDRGVFRRVLHVRAGESVTLDVATPVLSASSASSLLATRVTTTTPSRWLTPVRIAGLALVGVGLVAGVVSLTQYLDAASMASDARDGRGVGGAAWARYDNAINADRVLTVDQVCQRATATTGNTDAALARDFCDASARAGALNLGFGIAAAAFGVAGAVMLVVPQRVQARAAMAPGYGGLLLEGRF